jgi:hypothetical protein
VAVHGSDFCVCVCVFVCFCASRKYILTQPTGREEKRQCHPPLFHVDEMACESVTQYTLLVFLVLGYLAKMLAR